MVERTLRGRVAIAGVGESTYHRRGESPEAEFVLACRAVLSACEDAGIDVARVDGFASYANDRNEPSRLASALGIRELRFANMQWGWGGGGVAAAVGNAAAAIAAGLADTVVVFRALAQGEFGRFGQARGTGHVRGEAALTVPYGLISPAQMFAMRSMRLLEERGVPRSTLRAVALASYHHAQRNPRAIMHGHPLTAEAYDSSRWIVEPYRLYDCCLENDGAAAMVLVAAERAADLTDEPVYILGVAEGGAGRAGAPLHNDPDYASAGFRTLAPRLWEQAGFGPQDVDVAEVYENFTGGVVMALIEHGFCDYENAGEFLTCENLIAPDGRLPLNTSGGNLAECYMHGLGIQLEAVRQLRGESSNQVPGARVALAVAGPMVPVTSTCLYGTREVVA
ncbi:MAG: thiolase C-terminal domain-containing protein [Candidatus Binatia bacterium]